MRGIDHTVKTLNVPLFVSFDDEDGLTDTRLNCSIMSNCEFVVQTKPILVSDQEVLGIVGGANSSYWHPPFHTKSVLLYSKE